MARSTTRFISERSAKCIPTRKTIRSDKSARPEQEIKVRAGCAEMEVGGDGRSTRQGESTFHNQEIERAERTIALQKIRSWHLQMPPTPFDSRMTNMRLIRWVCDAYAGPFRNFKLETSHNENSFRLDNFDMCRILIRHRITGYLIIIDAVFVRRFNELLSRKCCCGSRKNVGDVLRQPWDNKFIIVALSDNRGVGKVQGWPDIAHFLKLSAGSCADVPQEDNSAQHTTIRLIYATDDPLSRTTTVHGQNGSRSRLRNNGWFLGRFTVAKSARIKWNKCARSLHGRKSPGLRSEGPISTRTNRKLTPGVLICPGNIGYWRYFWFTAFCPLRPCD